MFERIDKYREAPGGGKINSILIYILVNEQ